jgi:hypothetical protein
VQQAHGVYKNCGWSKAFNYKLTILWLIEAEVFQVTQVHKHINVGSHLCERSGVKISLNQNKV